MPKKKPKFYRSKLFTSKTGRVETANDYLWKPKKLSGEEWASLKDGKKHGLSHDGIGAEYKRHAGAKKSFLETVKKAEERRIRERKALGLE